MAMFGDFANNNTLANKIFGVSTNSNTWWNRTFDPLKVNQDFNALEAEKARAFSAQEAEKQRDYEERLANTAYQRQVNDLRSAGLNPYLAYSSGGATTPSGSMANTVTASASGQNNSQAIDLLGRIVLSAMKLAIKF